MDWTGLYELHGFYRALLTLRKTNPALRSGDPAVTIHRLHSKFDDKCFAFARRSGDDQVAVILNLSNQKISFPISEILLQGTWREVFLGYWCNFDLIEELHLDPWGYRVLEKQKG